MDGDSENFEGLLVGAEEKESAIFTIYAKAVNALRFWFEQFDTETWMFGIFRQKGNLFGELLFERMFDNKRLDARRAGQNFDHLGLRIKIIAFGKPDFKIFKKCG